MLFNNSFVCKRPPVFGRPLAASKRDTSSRYKYGRSQSNDHKTQLKMKFNEESTICDSGLILDTQYNTEFDGQEIIEEYKNGNIFGKQVPF